MGLSLGVAGVGKSAGVLERVCTPWAAHLLDVGEHFTVASEVLRDLGGINVLLQVVLLEETIDEASVVDLAAKVIVGFGGSLGHDLVRVVVEILITDINSLTILDWGSSQLLLVVASLLDQSLSHGGIDVVSALEVTNRVLHEAVITEFQDR